VSTSWFTPRRAKNGDEVLVCQGDEKQVFWSLERYFWDHDKRYFMVLRFHQRRGCDETDQDFVRWCLVVALNSSQT